MTPEEYQRLRSLFLEARQLAPAERSAFLESSCREDRSLRSEIELLLAHDSDQSEYLNKPVVHVVEAMGGANALSIGRDASESLASGDRVGRYVIGKSLGSGGWGDVYLADQTEPVHRKVALKVIKPGMDSRAVITRFQAEQQALAILDYPNIARVFDAGTTPRGYPFFAMEYVDGVLLTSYCDDQQLTIRDRVQLVVSICEAVHHAHQKGIIHRDLKPANILVTKIGDRAVPKVIDFGIAKALDDSSTRRTLRTAAGQAIGTPAYMSPEQAGATADVDTRSDIYSLGVILYELLTGSLPLEVLSSTADRDSDLMRIVREVDAPTPSSVASRACDDVSARRRSTPPALAKGLHGDLDAIVAKAMEKDRGRRYKTVPELADDLGRHLRSEPIYARSTGPITRSVKWAKRNPGKSVSVAALLLVVGVVAGLAIAQRIAERTRAFAEAARSRDEAIAKESEYAEARKRLDAKRQKAAELREACFTKWAPTSERARLSQMEHEVKKEEAQLEELAAQGREALERAFRYESPYSDGNPSPQTKAAFAAFLLGRWREALEAKDDARRMLYAAEVRKYDTENRHKAMLDGRGVLKVDVEPPKATAYLFRYEDYVTVRTDEPVLSRLVPVPTSGISRCRPDAWIDGFYPGDLCLVIDKVEPGSIAANEGLTAGDLIVKLNGSPCGAGLWVGDLKAEGLVAKAGVKRLDQIERVAGNVPESEIDLIARPLNDGMTEPVNLVIGGKTLEAARTAGLDISEQLGVTASSARDVMLCESVPVPLELVCLARGVPKFFTVPQGKTLGASCTVTAYPLILSKENIIRLRDALPADPGSYLLFVEAEGHENQRVALLVEREKGATVSVRLQPPDTTPEGYAYVPRGRFSSGGDADALGSTRQLVVREAEAFFIAKLELTNREWFEFVNSPETLKEMQNKAGAPNRYLPRDPGGVHAAWDDESNKWRADYGGDETPVSGISWDDVQAYLTWRNRKAVLTGERWCYDLPTDWEWEKAARGVDARPYPWGWRFDYSMCVSAYRGMGQLWGVVGHSEPRDESVYGLWDVGGSRLEWTSSEWAQNAPGPKTMSMRGGSWGYINERSFRCAMRYIGSSDYAEMNCGFRLAAHVRA